WKISKKFLSLFTHNNFYYLLFWDFAINRYYYLFKRDGNEKELHFPHNFSLQYHAKITINCLAIKTFFVDANCSLQAHSIFLGKQRKTFPIYLYPLQIFQFDKQIGN